MPQVKQGSTIRVHYTARLKSGEVVESTAGADPLRITVGAGKVMRGFEEALYGMGPGESKRVTIPPEKAFGRREPGSDIRLSHDAAAPVGKDSKVFQHQPVSAGTQGEYCVEVTDKGVLVDLNPHLADKELVFDIEVVEIEGT